MLTIYDTDRNHFWQWDTGQKLIVDADYACEVHFRDPDGAKAMIVEPYELDGKTVVNIPNILFQGIDAVLAWVYVCVGDECTKHEASFEVWPRQKPDDYVYTESELKDYRNLEKRIDEIEKNGVSEEQIETAVNKYLDANPLGVPDVTEADNGKVLTVVGGAWAVTDLPKYDGEYEVTPRAEESTTLLTAQKFLDSNVKVNKVPYFETSNHDGGETVYIATEVDIYGDQ